MRKGQDALAVLKSIRNLIAECPNCQEEFPLRRALLFYADAPIPGEVEELRRQRELDLRQQEQDLKKRRKRASVGAEETSVSVQLGFSLETIAPVLKGFGFNPRDCRPLGDPIDYLVFDGLTEGSLPERVCFVEVKTGEARLNAHQRSAEEAVQSGKVRWEAVSWPHK